MDDYTQALEAKFKDVRIDLVHFDNGATLESMQAYVLASNIPTKLMKDKGTTALDLGNFIYRKYGIIHEMTPEYSRTGEPKNSLAFYISKRSFEQMWHLQDWVLDIYNSHSTGDAKTDRYESALYWGGRFLIKRSGSDGVENPNQAKEIKKSAKKAKVPAKQSD